MKQKKPSDCERYFSQKLSDKPLFFPFSENSLDTFYILIWMNVFVVMKISLSNYLSKHGEKEKHFCKSQPTYFWVFGYDSYCMIVVSVFWLQAIGHNILTTKWKIHCYVIIIWDLLHKHLDMVIFWMMINW